MMKKTTKGTATTRADKATKIRAIAELINQGKSVSFIAEKYSVSRESIYAWRSLYASEVFSRTTRPDIAQKAVDAIALQKVEETNLETIKKQIAIGGAKILLKRIEEKADYIENKDLIAIIKLVDKTPSQIERSDDVLENALRNYALQHKAKDVGAHEAPLPC